MIRNKNKKPPMFEYKYMAHALGGFHGREYLNCEEGLEHALQNGFRYFETDFTLTEDNDLVCAHGWDRYNCKKVGMTYLDAFEHMTGELFMQQTIAGMHLMNAEKMYDYMCRYPDMCLELDFRELDHERCQKTVKRFLEIFQYNEEVLSRCLVQVYNFDMHKVIHKIYKFKYYQYIIRGAMDQLDKIIRTCKWRKICAVAMRRSEANEHDVKKVKDAGLYLLGYTLDDPERAKELLDMGMDTICTNYVYPGAQGDDLKLGILIYNSTPGAQETLSAYFPEDLLNRRMWETASHSWEYKTRMQMEKNDGCLLLPCMFAKEGYRFTGWKAKCKSFGEWRWLYEDGKWYSKDDPATAGEGRDGLEMMQIADEGMLMRDVFPEDGKIFLVACWESVE